MALIDWKYPIEAVHGALKKKVFGAAKRKSKNAKGEQPNWSVTYGTRSTTPSTTEVAHWTRFGAIGKLVGQRRKNNAQRITDQAAFKAQSTYPTLQKYLWSVCAAQYDAEQAEE